MEAIFELIQQHSRRLATAICVLMVVLMSASVADTVLFIVENMNEEVVVPSTHSQQTASRPGSESPSVDIASLNLFGQAQEQAPAEVVDAPETKLNLELQGVFTAEDKQRSTAIVAEGNKAGELYHIGDRLPGNATLTGVFNTYILIKRGNRVEKLMFEDSALRGTGNISSARSSNSGAVAESTRDRLARVRQQIANRTRDSGMINRSTGSSSTGNNADTLKNVVEDYRDKIDTNPQAVLDELGVESVEQGEAKGYRIGSDISHKGLLRAGLQQGDVILSVNDQPVGNVMNDKSLVNQALSAGRVRVEVQRGSRRFYLTVPVPK